MQTAIDRHGAEETLELYSTGRLSEVLVSELEEHILVCPSCQARLSEIDALRQVIARAGEELRRESIGTRAVRKWQLLWSVPKPIWAGMLATVLLAATISFYRSAADKVLIEIPLHADRGRSQPLTSKASPGNLLLRIDTTEFPRREEFWVQVADSNGQQVMLKSVVATKAQLTLPIHLGRGHYWVRLLAFDGTADKQLLREFALAVE